MDRRRSRSASPIAPPAAEAFRERLPSMVQTVKAIAIAELEADGRYDDAHHDRFFESSPTMPHCGRPPLFPDYLVCIAPGRNAAPRTPT